LLHVAGNTLGLTVRLRTFHVTPGAANTRHAAAAIVGLTDDALILVVIALVGARGCETTSPRGR
jgi:hypothetical protein